MARKKKLLRWWHRRWVVWSAGALLVVVILLLVQLGVKVRFLTADELQILIDPSQSVSSASSDGFVLLEYSVENKNFQFCSTNCSFELLDPYSGSVLFSEQQVLRSNQKVSKQFPVQIPLGSGQRLFYFQASCHNVRSLACQTDESSRLASALSTVNVEYSASERSLMLALKASLIRTSDALHQARSDELLLAQIASALTLPSSYQPPARADEALLGLRSAILEFYDQDFEASQSTLSVLPALSYTTELDHLMDQVERFNRTALLLGSLQGANEAFSFLLFSNDSKALLLRKEVVLLSNHSFSTFEEAVSFENVSLLLSITTITSDALVQRNKLLQGLQSNASELSALLHVPLTDQLCSDIAAINAAVKVHNANLNATNSSSFDQVLSFLGQDVLGVSANATHLVRGNSSVRNDAGLSLEVYLSFLPFPFLSDLPCQRASLPPVPSLSPIILNLSSSQLVPLTLDDPPLKCCIYGQCSVCELNASRYPVLFVHGHSFNKNDPPESSIDSFASFQKALSDEHLIINGADIDYSSKGYWSLMSVPVGVRTTYYYISYFDTDILAKSVRKEEGIESYSLRLKESIDLVKQNTGAEKVIIVAHSMGGLVARNYLSLFGEDDVAQLILIGTPNHGVTGRVLDLCGTFGDQKACEDMIPGSVFLKRLDSYTPSVPVSVIVGRGCDTDGVDGDGIVQVDSALLSGATITYINGSCTSLFGADLHSDLVNPALYPQVSNRVAALIAR